MKKSTSKKSAASSKKEKSTQSLFDSEIKTLEVVSRLMKEQGLAEVNLDIGQTKLHLRMYEGHVVAAAPVHMNGVAQHQAVGGVQVSDSAKTSAPAPDKKASVVKSPFVGTFYRSPSPNKDPFVEVGQVVNEGQTLCIIEAMKLMNEIESDCKCRITKVFPETGTPVEFGEPLFEFEPIR